MNLLVVDDECLVRWFMQRVLSKRGFKITVVSSVKEALHEINNTRYDLVITDLKMPKEDGTVLIEKLQQMEQSPKILVCSAYLKQEEEQRFKQQGIAVLKKPFKIQELEDTLRKILERY